MNEETYPRHDWTLASALTSAGIMAGICAGRGAHATLLVDTPSVRRVREAMGHLAKRSRLGDTVIFTFCGHGARIPTKRVDAAGFPLAAVGRTAPNGGYFETTICLYDRMMLASEFAESIAAFRRGVRFVAVIDACMSGTFAPEGFGGRVFGEHVAYVCRHGGAPHTTTATRGRAILHDLYAKHEALYERLARDRGTEDIRVEGLYFGACRDDQSTGAYGDGAGTQFTLAVLEAMSTHGAPTSYRALRTRVEARSRAWRATPVLYPFGVTNEDAKDWPPLA